MFALGVGQTHQEIKLIDTPIGGPWLVGGTLGVIACGVRCGIQGFVIGVVAGFLLPFLFAAVTASLPWLGASVSVAMFVPLTAFTLIGVTLGIIIL